jgi:hypothetical protein
MLLVGDGGGGSFGSKTSLSGNDIHPSYVKKKYIILQKSQEVILYALVSFKFPPLLPP